MKSIRMFRFIMVSLLALTVAQDGFARDVRSKIITESAVLASEGAINVEISVDQQKELAKTFVETELTIKNATEAIEMAGERLLGATNEDMKNIAIIIEQNKAKVMAERKLLKARDNIFEQVTAEIIPASYFSRFTAGVKSIGSTIASYFAPGTGTSEQKETAKLIIKGLTEQEVKITAKYALMQKDLTPTEKIVLKNRYEAIILQLEPAFYEQQLITGDTRSGMIKRGLLLSAVAAGTVIAGTLVKNRSFNEESIIEEDAPVKRITQQERDKNRAQTERSMRDRARQESTPYKVGSWIKQAPSKASDAARNLGQGVREGFARGADSKDYMENTYGPSSTQFIKEKAEAGKQFATQKLAEGKDFAAQKRAEWAQKKADGLAAERAEIIERESIIQKD